MAIPLTYREYAMGHGSTGRACPGDTWLEEKVLSPIVLI
jgi:hypothetical protein